MKGNFKIESHRLLAVEGKDEYNFFECILEYIDIKDVQLLDISGKDNFKKEFPLLYNLDGFSDVRAVGFIRDAKDKKADADFSSICSILGKYPLPIPDAANTVIDGKTVKEKTAGLACSSCRTMPTRECWRIFASHPWRWSRFSAVWIAIWNVARRPCRKMKGPAILPRQKYRPTSPPRRRLPTHWALVLEKGIGTLTTFVSRASSSFSETFRRLRPRVQLSCGKVFRAASAVGRERLWMATSRRFIQNP